MSNEIKVDKTMDLKGLPCPQPVIKVSKGIKEIEAKFLIEEALGDITSAILAEAEILGLILIGGETSLRVCQKLGVGRVTIVEEVVPGIPLLTLSNSLLAVTKAGGFGVEDSLIQATQRLRRLKAK
jgi:uncharacterized protein YgbK (DUF1537 family)